MTNTECVKGPWRILGMVATLEFGRVLLWLCFLGMFGLSFGG
jgi:hypothetical protein